MRKQKAGTPDFRDKLTTDMVSKVEKICKSDGHAPGKALIKKHVDLAIDNYIQDWYEVSLEALDLMEGAADFVTDDIIDDPEVIKEAKLRVVKNMFEDRPPGLHEHVADSVIQDMSKNPQGPEIPIEEPVPDDPPESAIIQDTVKQKKPAKKKTGKNKKKC